MKILLINGSPKGIRSNTYRLSSAFLEGYREKSEADVEEAHLAKMNIENCRGCFACWQKTPGICCIKDDMAAIIEKEIHADLIIWSFPLYFFNVPGILKNMIDRQLPISLPFMSEKEDGYGSGSHDCRYDDVHAKHVLISTCGFYSAQGNYDSVISMFDHFLGKGNYTSIFCGQGELFRVKELKARTDQYLDVIKTAGRQYADGGISKDTEAQLGMLLYPKETFEKMADASWGIDKDTGKKESEDLSFTRQMAALYNPAAYDGKDRVLEIRYTDLSTCYQIALNRDGSKVYLDGSLTPTTVIETPYSVWKAISRGEIEGAKALGDKLYSVTGDFSIMINWSRFFGNENPEPEKTNALKKPSMAAMLVPWIVFWMAVSIDGSIGSIVTLITCAAMPLIMSRHQLVIWDYLSFLIVSILVAAANLTGQNEMMTVIGYVCFGALWIGSCFVKEPLCASYVKYNYGGDKAYSNPLFMKTNYFLAACWGILYILTALWTAYFRTMGMGSVLMVVNNLMPVLMGIFTVWFEKWYPAHLAK